MNIQNIGPKQIEPCKENCRVIDRKSPEWASFVESVKTAGIQVPLIVNQSDGKYLLIAGHRRLAAALELGLLTVPCDVRTVSEVYASELRVIENLQRADLTPFEEAGQIAHLMEIRNNVEIADIAAMLGKSTTWVYQRAKIGTLDAKIQKACANWSVAALVLLACQPEDQHEELVKACTKWDKSPSYGQIESVICSRRRLLKQAPWKLDADFKPCKCVDCPKRTGAQKELFGLGDADAAKKDECLDETCYQGKVKQHLEAVYKAAGDKKPIFAWTHYESGDIKIGNDTVAVLGTEKYRESFKGDKTPTVAINIATGQKMKIVIRKDEAKVQKAEANPETGKVETSMKEKKAQLQRRRDFYCIEKIKAKLVECDSLDKIEIKIDELECLVLLIGASAHVEYRIESHKKLQAALDKAREEAEELYPNPQQVTVKLGFWLQLISPLREKIHRSNPGGVTPDVVTWAKRISKIVKLDWDALSKEAEKEIPTPKSWSKK